MRICTLRTSHTEHTSLRPEHSRRTAFTIVELLVSMAIIGLLVALTVPAVMSARDASRRLDCQNRLRQFGIAIHQFEANSRRLPNSLECRSGVPSKTSRTVQVHLLPFLEQAPAYQEIMNALEKFEHYDVVTRSFSFAIFHCPFETESAGINYRVCSGRTVSYERGFPLNPRRYSSQLHGGGAFAMWPTCDGGIRLAEVTDGLSNTVAMSERIISRGSGGRFDPKRDIWYSGARAVGFDPHQRSEDDAISVCAAFGDPDSVRLYTPFAGRSYHLGGFKDSVYNHVMPPNSQVPDCTFYPEGRVVPELTVVDVLHEAAMAARSDHRDGTVSVLMLDGAVRMFSPHVDRELWRSLASRADGDVTLN